MNEPPTTLTDCASPPEVARVLRRAAEHYSWSATELEAAWQDRSAGAIWAWIATRFEDLADRIEKRWERI